jgi:hypothetical protein
MIADRYLATLTGGVLLRGGLLLGVIRDDTTGYTVMAG